MDYVIQLNIVKNLDIISLSNWCQVDRMRRSICSDDRFWRDLAREHRLTKEDGSKIKNRKDYIDNVASLYSGIDRDIVNTWINNSQRLRLSDFTDDNISNMIGNLVNLKELSIYMPKLKRLPNSISQLVNLERLIIDESSITKLPDTLCKLPKLHSIHISGSELKHLPENIGDLERLHSLIVVNSNITTVPRSIGKLKNLRILMLEYNDLRSLPDSITDIVCKKKNHSYYNRPPTYKQPDCLKEIFVQGNPNLVLSSHLERRLYTHIIGYSYSYGKRAMFEDEIQKEIEKEIQEDDMKQDEMSQDDWMYDMGEDSRDDEDMDDGYDDDNDWM